MIRAIFFDFYGVWLPDVFAEYLAEAEQLGPQVSDELVVAVNQYYHGEMSLNDLAGKFKFSMNRPDIDADKLLLDQRNISPAIISFMRELHEHFIKLGVLANLGVQEYKLLSDFNETNQVLEVIAGPLPFRSPQPLLSPDIFSQALHAIGEPPQSCLAVTGNTNYQHFAESLGIQVLPFEGFPKLRETLLARITSEAQQANNA